MEKPLIFPRYIGLAVVPANLAVGDNVYTGIDLLLDDLLRYLVLYAAQLFQGDLALVVLAYGASQAWRLGSRAYLWVVADDCSYQGDSPRGLRYCEM